MPLRRLNKLRLNDQDRQNLTAIEENLKFLGRKRSWMSDRINDTTASESFEQMASLEVSPNASILLVSLIIDSEDKESSTGLVDGLAASTTGGVASVIQILRNGKAFARFQMDSGTELSGFQCLDTSPQSRTYTYTVEARNTGAGAALSITNMRLFALEIS